MTAPQVKAGDVAMHLDGENHMAVILAVDDAECDTLFFSSRPNWSEKSRKATVDELALAGFVHRRRTYLAYARRLVCDFEPMGQVFPEHRIESLKQEFLAPPKELVLQQAGT